MTYQRKRRGISEMLRLFLCVYLYRHDIYTDIFLCKYLFVYKLFFPAHAPFGKRAEDEHAADGSLADFKGKTEQEGERQGGDDEKCITGNVKLCKINPELAACCIVSTFYGDLDSAQKVKASDEYGETQIRYCPKKDSYRVAVQVEQKHIIVDKVHDYAEYNCHRDLQKPDRVEFFS